MKGFRALAMAAVAAAGFTACIERHEPEPARPAPPLTVVVNVHLRARVAAPEVPATDYEADDWPPPDAGASASMAVARPYEDFAGSAVLYGGGTDAAASFVATP